MRRTTLAFFFFAFGSLLTIGCTGPNPDYTGPATTLPDAGVDGGLISDGQMAECPTYLGKTQGFAFHPDAERCPNWVSLPADGQAFGDKTGIWQQYSLQLEVRYVVQQFAGAASDTWTTQPGSQRTDQNANTWRVFDKNTSSITPTLAQGGTIIGLTRLRVDRLKRQVVVEPCPGMNGTCQLWQ